MPKQSEWEIVEGPAGETAAEIEMQQFLYGMVRVLKPALVVETGTYYGHSAWAMALACKRNAKGRVVSCEVNREYLERARYLCSGGLGEDVSDRLELRECPSWDLPELREADFVFCDSDYKFRSEEIVRVKPGAVIVVHDTRISYDSSIEPLEGLVRQLGGVCFQTYRGFGILVQSNPTC